MIVQAFPFHNESAALANAPVDRVFAYLDDPKALAAHMGESSMMMAGSRMSIDVDADGGRVVGSKIRMQGRMMGIPLSLEGHRNRYQAGLCLRGNDDGQE